MTESILTPQMPLNISFIGSGQVATQLACALQAYCQIVDIYSRNYAHAAALASRCQARAIDRISALNQNMDLLIIAVKDDAIAEVVAELALCQVQAIVVHTSGATALDVLAEKLMRSGVIYPLQTFSKNNAISWLDTPIFIESHQQDDLQLLRQVATYLSQKVYVYNSAQRLTLHLSAVFACNFSNLCIDIAQQLLLDVDVDPDLLKPLIYKTIDNLNHRPAFFNQTGPAVRDDQQVLARHQTLLNTHPHWQQLYCQLSQAIVLRHNKITADISES